MTYYKCVLIYFDFVMVNCAFLTPLVFSKNHQSEVATYVNKIKGSVFCMIPAGNCTRVPMTYFYLKLS